MDIDTEKLRALAQAATPGKWVSEPDMRQDYSPHSWTYSGEDYVAGYNISSDGKEIVGAEGILASGEDEAAYIAAAHPAAVLALLDALDERNAENARLREALRTIAYAPPGACGPTLAESITIARTALEGGAP